MSASKNKSKSSGLRFLWIPGRKNHGHKGRYDTTNKHISYSSKFGNKNNAPWSLGGSKGLEKLVEPEIPGGSEGTSRIIAALPATYSIAAAGASTTVMKLDDTNQFTILQEKDEQDVVNNINYSNSEEVNTEKKCLNDNPSVNNHQEKATCKGEKPQKLDKKEMHNEKSKDNINSIESLHEKKLKDSSFDIADSSLYVNKYSGKKKKNKKKKNKNTCDNPNDAEDDPDAQIVKCLYFTLMCCECTIS